MKYAHATLIAVSLGLVMVSPLYAGQTDRGNYCDKSKVHEIENRLDRQYRRIERGVERDRLTHKEAKQLRKHYHGIRRLAHEYRQDGYLSAREYKKLTRKLNTNSRLIKEYTQNGIDRYVAYHDEYSPNRQKGFHW